MELLLHQAGGVLWSPSVLSRVLTAQPFVRRLTSLSGKAQTSACRLQEELEKLRTAGPLESSETEEASQLKAGRGWGGGHTCGVCSGAGATLGLGKGPGRGEPTPRDLPSALVPLVTPQGWSGGS